MLSRLRFSLGLLSALISLWVQSTEATWATSFGSGSSSEWSWASSAATDSSGNVFVTGSFEGSALTLGSNTLSSAVAQNIYVAKLDPAGSVLWAVSFGDSNDGSGIDITVDSAGDAIVIGNVDSFTSLVISPSITLTQQGSAKNLVVIKLAGATGTAVWARNFGGDGSIYNGLGGVDTDSSGNVYVVGMTEATSLAMDSVTLTNTNAGGYNGFVFKLSGSTGTVSWAKIAASGSSYFRGITVDPSDNIYVTGEYISPTLTIGTTTLNNADTSGSSSDAFLLKADSSTGALSWAQSVGGTNYESSPFMVTDGLGYIYLIFASGSSTLAMGATTITVPGSGFRRAVAKIDASTGVPTWAIQLTGVNDYVALAVDPTDSNLYVTGTFSDATLAIGAFTLTNSGGTNSNNEVFLAKLDKTTGAALTAVSYGGIYADYVTAMCVDSTGAATLVGSFQGNSGTTTLTFDGVTLTLQGQGDTYVARVVEVAPQTEPTTPIDTSAAASKSSSSSVSSESSPLSDLGIGFLVAGLAVAVRLAVLGIIYIKRKQGKKELPTATLEVMPTRH